MKTKIGVNFNKLLFLQAKLLYHLKMEDVKITNKTNRVKIRECNIVPSWCHLHHGYLCTNMMKIDYLK